MHVFFFRHAGEHKMSIFHCFSSSTCCKRSIPVNNLNPLSSLFISASTTRAKNTCNKLHNICFNRKKLSAHVAKVLLCERTVPRERYGLVVLKRGVKIPLYQPVSSSFCSKTRTRPEDRSDINSILCVCQIMVWLLLNLYVIADIVLSKENLWEWFISIL